MKHLTNLYNPKNEDAKIMITHGSHETLQEAWENQERWLADKFIGLPIATDYYTVAELLNMGMVGIYSI